MVFWGIDIFHFHAVSIGAFTLLFYKGHKKTLKKDDVLQNNFGAPRGYWWVSALSQHVSHAGETGGD